MHTVSFTVLNLQDDYVRKRLNIIRFLSASVSRTGTYCKTIKQKASYTREILGQAGRTSAWWNNFVNQIALPPEEWRKNFRVSRDSLYLLAEELRSYVEGTLLYFHSFSIFVWTGENNSHTTNVWTHIFFENGEKSLCF